jgi:hypothetical protein
MRSIEWAVCPSALIRAAIRTVGGGAKEVPELSEGSSGEAERETSRAAVATDS